MLKIFKWIYKLGYKDAEQKYYHALNMVTLSPTERDLQELMLRDSGVDNERKAEIYRKLAMDERLRGIIRDVFIGEPHFIERHIEPESRFLP